MPLRYLSTNLAYLFPSDGIDFMHPLFSRITHLQVWDDLDTARWEEWSGLTTIPNLTHLAFLLTKSSSIFKNTLAACPGLKVIIFQYSSLGDNPEFGVESLAHDTRFVCLHARPFYVDWQIGARGGEDFWVRAEQFIARRNRGEIAQTVLYNVVVFSNPLPGHVCFDPARLSVAVQSPAISQHVRNVCILHSLVGFPDDLQPIFAKCSAIQNLFLIGRHSALLPFLSVMPLRRLYTGLAYLFALAGIDFMHLLFSQITHLQLADRLPNAQWEEWQGLSTIPNLTHLAFQRLETLSIFQNILPACPGLQVLVHLQPYAKKSEIVLESLANDTRFVSMPATSLSTDWQIGARGGDDMWVRAEKFIARRNNGEIDRKIFVLQEEASRTITSRSER
ncbi:Tyrosinase central domain-containing protein [Mycena sanguinolenta]|uniref:Tyrosinase central domain-containing protein n=1 Tax=Mycena sanguinolenta TaxID=230812 RepID=A0A8H6YSD4_9AGAR|nr:Tyrosinase central domain-containing protein [Mycena sanguinolenta]